MQAGELVHVIADCHIYDRHVPVIQELIQRPVYPAPTVYLNPEVRDFYQFTVDDLVVENYQMCIRDRNTEVSCVGIYGDGNLYDERIHTLSKEDLDGCILDEKTAVELFGTVQAVGKEITMGGRAYTVRQVLRTREREALFSAGDEQQFTWVNLSRGEDAVSYTHLSVNNSSIAK